MNEGLNSRYCMMFEFHYLINHLSIDTIDSHIDPQCSTRTFLTTFLIWVMLVDETAQLRPRPAHRGEPPEAKKSTL